MAVPSVLRGIRRIRATGVVARLVLAGALAVGAVALTGEALGAPSAGAATNATNPGSAPVTGTLSNITFFRQAGPNRYGTAARVAADTFGSSAPTVVLATGASFPDALAASYLAGTEAGGAPILLTSPSALSPETSAALAELHATHVVIVGGTSAVSSAVQTSLAASYQVSRIAGTTRYDTAEMVDTRKGAPVGTDGSGQPTAILVSGAEFADALSAAPLGYARHLPIVLTDPHGLSPQAKAALINDHITHVVQVGGSGAIDPAVTQTVKTLGISVEEVAGTDRSKTSILLAADELANYGFTNVHLALASGTDFADALAGGPNAGAAGSPLLLTASGSDPGSAPGWAAGHCATLSSGDIFGGTGSIGDSTTQLVGLACPSNGSIQLNTGIGPVVASGGGGATGSGTAILSPAPTTTLTATVAICGPPGSLAPCRVGLGQTVNFGAFPSRQGACGALNPPTAITQSSGQPLNNGEAQTRYTTSATSGTCIVTATANHYSASLAIPAVQPPTCTSCCGPVPAGSSSQGLPCCYSPPCTTQVCPYSSTSTTGATAQPAIIVCPAQPVPAPGPLPAPAPATSRSIT